MEASEITMEGTQWLKPYLLRVASRVYELEAGLTKQKHGPTNLLVPAYESCNTHAGIVLRALNFSAFHSTSVEQFMFNRGSVLDISIYPKIILYAMWLSCPKCLISQ